MNPKFIYILVDWDVKHIIGAYSCQEEARAYYDKFQDDEHLQIVTREIIYETE